MCGTQMGTKHAECAQSSIIEETSEIYPLKVTGYYVYVNHDYNMFKVRQMVRQKLENIAFPEN